jgi:hypothetical protein
MIVHFIKNKGGGSPKSATDYMLGEERNREKARVLQGNPELTLAIAENLTFKHKHTVGVLSFEEENISEKSKFEIMQSFEETLLAGLDKDQYNITWIEHTDKDRLELNFIIPKVDLNSGKAMNPYFDAVDRDLVTAWRDTINFDYGLSDPNDPSKKQSHVIAKDLPKDKKQLSESIGNSIFAELQQGNISNRDDVVKHIESLGLEIANVKPKSISIKDPSGKANIRLKGELYEENFRYSERYTEENARNRAEYTKNRAENISRVRTELAELKERKHQFNENRFSKERTAGKGRTNANISEWDKGRKEHSDISTQEHRQNSVDSRDTNRNIDNNSVGIGSLQSLSNESDREIQSGVARTTTGSREHTNRKEIITENRDERGQESDLFSCETRAKSGNVSKPRQTNSFKNQQIERANNEKRILEQLRAVIETTRRIAEYVSRQSRELAERIKQSIAVNQQIEQREQDTSGFNQDTSVTNQQIEQRESESAGINQEIEQRKPTIQRIGSYLQSYISELESEKAREQENIRESAKQRSNEQSELVRGAKSKGGMEK